MRTLYFTSVAIMTILFSCKKQKAPAQAMEIPTLIAQNVEAASGFSIKTYARYKEIKVNAPWPEATDTLTYVLYPKGTAKPSVKGNATFIEIPIERVIVTSTTDIPMLESLNIENRLIGFPNTDYISSEKTRKLIDSGTVKELGNENSMNTEIVLEANPELIIGFSASSNTKTYDLFAKNGISVVLNGSWLEQNPLGRAEWIKFIAAFFNKENEARTIFSEIKTAYTEAKSIAENTTEKPTLLSGNMYKDVWYAPGGNSYMGQLFKDAHTHYLWNDSEKTGSIALSFESVLEKAQTAQAWIGSGNAHSLNILQKSNHQYALFDAFKNKAVYSSSLKIGKKGGMIYYELGPMRPDLILKDIIKISHPELLPQYELYFFKKLH